MDFDEYWTEEREYEFGRLTHNRPFAYKQIAKEIWDAAMENVPTVPEEDCPMLIGGDKIK